MWSKICFLIFLYFIFLWFFFQFLSFSFHFSIFFFWYRISFPFDFISSLWTNIEMGTKFRNEYRKRLKEKRMREPLQPCDRNIKFICSFFFSFYFADCVNTMCKFICWFFTWNTISETNSINLFCFVREQPDWNEVKKIKKIINQNSKKNKKEIHGLTNS